MPDVEELLATRLWGSMANICSLSDDLEVLRTDSGSSIVQ